jgi:hypothetical protein
MNTGPGLLGDFGQVENRFVLTKLPSTSTLVLADRGAQVAWRPNHREA